MNSPIGRRTALMLIAVLTAAIAAVVTRVLQVGAFTVAAGIRRLLAEPRAPAGPFVSAAAGSATAARPVAVQNGKGLVCYHPSYDHHDGQRVTRALQEAAALGATYLRADVNWGDIMPSPGEVNAPALEWHAGFFGTAREAFGFSPVAVLSNAAASVADVPIERRMELWEQYVAAVARTLAGKCRHFQLLNEPNNPVFRFFPNDASAAALRSAATIIRRHIPDARLSVNFLLDIWPWQNQLAQLMSDLPEAIDIVGIDAYPGTWNIGLTSAYGDWDTLPGVLRAKLPDLRSNQAFAICETGYATNIPFVRDMTAQVEYFRRLRQSVAALRQFEFVGIYELTDENSRAKLDPEAHFGLLDSRLRRKPAFDEVHRLFGELNA